MRYFPKVTNGYLGTIRAGAQPYQKVTTRKSDRKTVQIDVKVKNSRDFRDGGKMRTQEEIEKSKKILQKILSEENFDSYNGGYALGAKHALNWVLGNSLSIVELAKGQWLSNKVNKV